MELIRSKKMNLIGNAKSVEEMVAEDFKINVNISKTTSVGRINEEN